MTRIMVIAAVAACAALQGHAQALHEGHLAAIDANGDGAVSRDEYDTYGARAFQRLDANSDRMLSPAELQNSNVADGATDDLDADGDGMVSRQEFGRRMTADFTAADQDGNGMID